MQVINLRQPFAAQKLELENGSGFEEVFEAALFLT